MDQRLRIALISFCLAVPVSAHAEPVTRERVASSSLDDAAAWTAYLDRSEENAAKDASALDAEVQAAKLKLAYAAPSGGDFKLSARHGDAYFSTSEATALADVVISYQTPSGGWSKHVGYSHGPRRPAMQWTSQSKPGSSPHYLGTFDNRSTTEQLQFLANVWLATKRDDCKVAFLKGLDYVLAAQYPHGGWPQVYPLEGDYHDDVTLNDDVLTHILELLHGVASGEPRFALVEEAQRKRASDALDRGLRLAARLQIEREGERLGWAGQYDALTREPSSARAYEPATMSGVESSQLIKFLMTIPEPSEETKAMIESALKWLDEAKVTGLCRVKRDGRTIYEPCSDSSETFWARFYDLKTGLPIFPARDGVVYTSFAEMAAKNDKLGYDYYSTRPGSILNNGQKKWRKMLARKS